MWAELWRLKTQSGGCSPHGPHFPCIGGLQPVTPSSVGRRLVPLGWGPREESRPPASGGRGVGRRRTQDPLLVLSLAGGLGRQVGGWGTPSGLWWGMEQRSPSTPALTLGTWTGDKLTSLPVICAQSPKISEARRGGYSGGYSITLGNGYGYGWRKDLCPQSQGTALDRHRLGLTDPLPEP